MRSKVILSIILILALSLPLTGALCKSKKKTTGPVNLKVWLYGKDKKEFDDLVSDFQSDNSEVSFEFTEKSGNESAYEKELVDAIAAKNGPDIAMIREDWVAKHYDKLINMPPAEEQSEEALVKELRDVFVSAVGEKAIYNNKVYGLPLKMDTLALYYNRSHFDEADLNDAPKNWNEFVYDVKKLTQRDQFGNITRSAAALGTSSNIEHSEDILYALMLQNGTKMVSDDLKSATFNTSITKASGEVYYPGTNALDFYNSFANPSKETYTWNASLANSVKAFAEGKVSMIFDYSNREEEIYNLNPTFRFDIAPFPQIKDTANPATYPYFWLYSVTNNTSNAAVSWDFINYLSRSAGSVKKEKAQEDYKDMSEGNSVFEGQIYIARAFYKTRKPEEVDQIFVTTIKNVIGGQPLQAAMDAASAGVTSILQGKE